MMIEDHIGLIAKAIEETPHFSVPHVGSFIRQQQPARIEKDVVYPPYEMLLFVPYTTQYATEFIAFVQKKKGGTFTSAFQSAEDIGKELVVYLEKYGELEIKTYGKLKRKDNGLLSFDRAEDWKWSELQLSGETPTTKPVTPLPAPKLPEAKAVSEVKFEISAQKTAPAELPKIAKDVPAAPPKTEGGKAFKNGLTIAFVLMILAATIGLFFFRSQITETLGIESGPKQKIVVEHSSEQDILIEALEGDSLVEVGGGGVVPLGKESVPSEGNSKNKNENSSDDLKEPSPDTPVESSEEGKTLYHIIVGVAASKTEGEKLVSEWKTKGFDAEMIPSEKGTKYRISVFKSDHLNTTDKKLSELKLHSKIPYDTWVLKINK